MTQRSTGQLVLGALLLLAGVVLLLDRADVLPATAEVWSVVGSLAVVAVGLCALVVVPRAWLGPAVLVAVGTLGLLDALDLVRSGADGYVLPVALAALGAAVLLVSTRQHGEEEIRALAIFSSARRQPTSRQFRSAALIAVFGGVDLDLRTAGVVGRARVDVFTMFGGVEITVPDGWRVQLVSLSVFGGSDDTTAPPPGDDAPTLEVHAVSVFGGTSVKRAEQPAVAGA
jgi:hypothetical protein